MYHKNIPVSLHLLKAYDTIFNFIAVADSRSLELPASKTLTSDKECLDLLNATYLRMVRLIREEQEDIEGLDRQIGRDDLEIIRCSKNIDE